MDPQKEKSNANMNINEPTKSIQLANEKEAESNTIRNYLPEGTMLMKMKSCIRLEQLFRQKQNFTDNKIQTVPPILRPNPDWEEDLANATIIDDKIRERIKSYTYVEKKVKRPCSCHEEVKSGIAPWLKMNDGRMVPGFGIGTWPGFTKKVTLRRQIEKNKKIRGSEVTKAVENAIDVGYRHIDTAFIYDTEKYVGRAVNKKIEEGVVRRKDLFITTKLWNDKHRKKDVVAALKSSLKLLNLSYVDLYLIHWPIALDEEGNFLDIDYLETWEGMIEAQVQSLTKSIGVSNFNEIQLNRIITCSHVKPAVLQIELNLNLQQPQLLSFCRKHDILVGGFKPFGFVLDDLKEAPPPRVDDPYLASLAKKYKKSVAQIILRYIVELGTFPIPKWVNKPQMVENLNIYDFQFTQAERNRLRRFDRNYRTVPVEHWSEAPDYPF